MDECDPAYYHDAFDAGFERSEREWRGRMRQIVEGLELRITTTRDVGESLRWTTEYAEGRISAFDEALRLVRRIGGLDD